MEIAGTEIYILGLPWDGTSVAAIVAAAVGIATLIISARQTKSGRKDAARSLDFQMSAEQRSQFQTAISSATKQALSADARERNIGLTLLGSMLTDPWATKADKELIAAVGEILE